VWLFLAKRLPWGRAPAPVEPEISAVASLCRAKAIQAVIIFEIDHF